MTEYIIKRERWRNGYWNVIRDAVTGKKIAYKKWGNNHYLKDEFIEYVIGKKFKVSEQEYIYDEKRNKLEVYPEISEEITEEAEISEAKKEEIEEIEKIEKQIYNVNVARELVVYGYDRTESGKYMIEIRFFNFVFPPNMTKYQLRNKLANILNSYCMGILDNEYEAKIGIWDIENMDIERDNNLISNTGYVLAKTFPTENYIGGKPLSEITITVTIDLNTDEIYKGD